MYFDSNVGEMSIERNSWFLKLSKMSTHDTSIDRQFWVEKRECFWFFPKLIGYKDMVEMSWLKKWALKWQVWSSFKLKITEKIDILKVLMWW